MIDILDPPLEAVAIPGVGREALDRLIGAHVVRRVLDVGTIASAAATDAPQHHAVLGALIEHVTTSERSEAIALLREPRVSGALARVFSAFAARNASLSRRLSHLPAVLPALRDRLEGGWTVMLQPGEAVPLDAASLVRNHSGEVVSAAPEALSSDPRLVREPRRRITHLHVEVFDPRDVPELSEQRLPGESPSPLTPAQLERECAAAFAAIELAWPEAMDDVRTFFRAILPMEMPYERWHSASTGEYPGVLQLTVRSSGEPLLLAESIMHEAAHSKLDVAMGLERFLIDDGVRRYRHPWRPDLRPITGVLLGAHAFLAVLLFYRRVYALTGNPFAAREVETRTREVGSALDTLAREATFTSSGRHLFDAMREAHEGG